MIFKIVSQTCLRHALALPISVTRYVDVASGDMSSINKLLKRNANMKVIALALACILAVVVAQTACPLTGLTNTQNQVLGSVCQEGSPSCCSSASLGTIAAEVAVFEGISIGCKSQALRYLCGRCNVNAQLSKTILLNTTRVLVPCTPLCKDIFNACSKNGLYGGMNQTAYCTSIYASDNTASCWAGASNVVLSVAVVFVAVLAFFAF